MLTTFVTIAVIAAVIALWTISAQRRPVVLDENISNAMSQIGVQLSGHLAAPWDLKKLPYPWGKEGVT